MTDQNLAFEPSAASLPADLHSSLSRLRQGFRQERNPSAAVRIDRLQRLWTALDQHAQPLCEALSADFGYRSPRQSYFADVATTGKAIRRAAAGVKRWMRPERRKVDFPFSWLGASAKVVYQPLGVIGILSPWNIPVNLTLSPLAGVLAAGNRALVKPSEHTPATSEVMCQLLGSAFSPDEVAVVTGGADIGRAFSGLPLDHLVFTGGEAVARQIMRAAAEHLTPLTLELGGKSPVLIGSDADLDLAARRIVFGKVFNAGQVCLAPDYVLVPRQQRDTLIALLQAQIAASLPGGAASPDFVSVINSRQGDRLHGYLQEARDAGVPVHGEVDRPADGNRIPVTLVVDPPDALRISQEEIFGPLLVIRSYDDLGEAIAYINERPSPLALYYFGKHSAERQRVIEGTASGGVTINDVIMHYTFDDLPFGGVGPSGMGAYHGFDGFRQFSNARPVYRQTRLDLGKLIRPPYGKPFDLFSKHLMRRG